MLSHSSKHLPPLPTVATLTHVQVYRTIIANHTRQILLINMSGKLDQSLDQIMKDAGPTAGRRGPRRTERRAANKAKVAVSAPTGGIQKNKMTMAKSTRASAVQVPIKMTGDSKIIISNLPEDVNETQIKVC